MKLPRTVRLDGSDEQVFDHAAAAGEWAIPGSFAFLDMDPETAPAKQRQAFRCGWLGLDSFAFASLVEVAEIAPAEVAALTERLAEHLLRQYGAPDPAAARAAAAAEIADAQSLCDHKLHTLLALTRLPTEDGLDEAVRVIRPERADQHARIWEILPDQES